MRKESALGMVGGGIGILAAVFLLWLSGMFSVFDVDTSDVANRAVVGLTASAVGMAMTMLRTHIVWGVVTICAGVVAWEALAYLGIPTAIFFVLAGLLIIHDAAMRPKPETKENESV